MRIIFQWPVTFKRKLILLDDTNLPGMTLNALKRHGMLYLNDVDPKSKKYIKTFGEKGRWYVELEKKRLGI